MVAVSSAIHVSLDNHLSSRLGERPWSASEPASPPLEVRLVSIIGYVVFILGDGAIRGVGGNARLSQDGYHYAVLSTRVRKAILPGCLLMIGSEII